MEPEQIVVNYKTIENTQPREVQLKQMKNY